MELGFDCVEARAERYAAAPTLTLGLRVTEATGQHVGAIALRCQIRIQPHQRAYSTGEADGLRDLFGERARWGETLKPIQFATVPVMVPAFQDSVVVDLPVPCTYDLEVAASRYLDALGGGDVPLLLLFSGTIFGNGNGAFSVEPVPWHLECAYRLPVAVWREAMDVHFPNSAWLRLHRDTMAELGRFKSDRALATWEETIEVLLREATA
jgi:hypothetical protein